MSQVSNQNSTVDVAQNSLFFFFFLIQQGGEPIYSDSLEQMS